MIGSFIDRIVPEKELPITYTSYSPCFRKEKGCLLYTSKQRDIHLENGECREIRLHSDLRLALPGTGIRFAVILAHDFVEIFCRPFFIFRLQIIAVRRPSAHNFLLPAE